MMVINWLFDCLFDTRSKRWHIDSLVQGHLVDQQVFQRDDLCWKNRFSDEKTRPQCMGSTLYLHKRCWLCFCHCCSQMFETLIMQRQKWAISGRDIHKQWHFIVHVYHECSGWLNFIRIICWLAENYFCRTLKSIFYFCFSNLFAF